MTFRPLPLVATVSLIALAGCSRPIDLDLRSLGDGFSTTEAAQNVAARPTPDSRGVISYPSYQVAMARRGDTVADVAARLGLDANALAHHNALQAQTPLRAGELLALPGRVGAAPGGGTVTATPLPSGREPLRHSVTRGETAYSIARLYDVPIQALAQYNGLAADMAVRPGQTLLIPVAGGSPTSEVAPTTAPGTGSPTPVPPSASTALPAQTPAPVSAGTTTTSAPAPAPTPAPQPAPTTTPASAPSAQMVMPVSGPIIREYTRGRNDGIDISAAAGAAVKAADAGTVAAITQNTNGAQIVVIKHSGELLTVYVNLTDLTVSKGSTVARGQTIGKVAAGDPPSLHFEVRKGLESADPADYLP